MGSHAQGQMTDTPPKPKPRRWLVVGLLPLACWGLWPRNDPRFVGSWQLTDTAFRTPFDLTLNCKVIPYRDGFPVPEAEQFRWFTAGPFVRSDGWFLYRVVSTDRITLTNPVTGRERDLRRNQAVP